MMTSHEYHFTFADLSRVLVPPLALLAAFAMFMHAGSAGGLLPAPQPTLDVDRTILIHQAQASTRSNPARVLLIGDSSCLMNISATDLGQTLGQPVLNLATLSHVDLPTHAKLIANYARANPGPPLTVVLLMHPEALRLPRRNEYFSQVIHHYLALEDHLPEHVGTAARWLGVEHFRGRFLARALPMTLPGAYGQAYGFTHLLWKSMTERGGSAIDPRVYRSEGSAEYRLAEQLKAPSETFRSLLPHGTKLLMALTPTPAGFALDSHQEICGEILHNWSKWLSPDATLTLPYTLPDDQFASTSHLNEAGARGYTQLLAQALINYISAPR